MAYRYHYCYSYKTIIHKSTLAELSYFWGKVSQNYQFFENEYGGVEEELPMFVAVIITLSV